MAGRPKRVFSDEEVGEIERLALLNCNTNTIAVALDIPFKTLERHFAKKLRACRALWKVGLRESQDKLKETSADMCKFLGKNELGQEDKQTVKTISSAPQMTESEKKASEAAARIYKLKLAE